MTIKWSDVCITSVKATIISAIRHGYSHNNASHWLRWRKTTNNLMQTHLHVLFQIVKSYRNVLATFLELNVWVTGQHKV